MNGANDAPEELDRLMNIPSGNGKSLTVSSVQNASSQQIVLISFKPWLKVYVYKLVLVINHLKISLAASR